MDERNFENENELSGIDEIKTNEESVETNEVPVAETVSETTEYEREPKVESTSYEDVRETSVTPQERSANTQSFSNTQTYNNTPYGYSTGSDNRTYRVYGESATNPAEPVKKKKQGAGLTWPKTIAAAAVFAIVGAGTLKGIDIAYNHYTGKTNNTVATATTEEQKVDDVAQASTISEGNTTIYDVSQIAKNAMPSIVSITNKSIETVQTWFRQYQQEVEGAGSGIIIKQDGNKLFIMTNYHVVEGAMSLTVSFCDDSLCEATVRGYNEDADLAIVEVDMTKMSSDAVKQIKTAVIGDSDALEIGEPAIVIGNALGYGQSLSGGYISAKNRVLDKNQIGLIQTDAAINPGNSGGALLNSKGEVVGVNSSKLADTKVEGMGFAIPINEAMKLMQGVIDGTDKSVDNSKNNNDIGNNNGNGRDDGYQGGNGYDELDPFSGFGDGFGGFDEFFGYGNGNNGNRNGNNNNGNEQSENTQKAYLGVVGSPVTADYSEYLNMPEGVYITQVVTMSAAEEAGIKAGDIITSVDGKDIKDMDTLKEYVSTKNVGDKISVTYQRKDSKGDYSENTVEVTLKEMSNQ
ncbi:MAG: trypsin-like peptidase domain-containing protein [Lachnospiraceae bacterium]|nr:trypsin-like peptidase domain-containing protein [Lachnospiraceae bacterium]